MTQNSPELLLRGDRAVVEPWAQRDAFHAVVNGLGGSIIRPGDVARETKLRDNSFYLTAGDHSGIKWTTTGSRLFAAPGARMTRLAVFESDADVSGLEFSSVGSENNKSHLVSIGAKGNVTFTNCRFRKNVMIREFAKRLQFSDDTTIDGNRLDAFVQSLIDRFNKLLPRDIERTWTETTIVSGYQPAVGANFGNAAMPWMSVLNDSTNAPDAPPYYPTNKWRVRGTEVDGIVPGSNGYQRCWSTSSFITPRRHPVLATEIRYRTFRLRLRWTTRSARRTGRKATARFSG